MFSIFFIPNDYVLINYHFVPFIISYFRHFCHFTHLGWLYKPPYKFVTLTLIFQYIRATFHFALFSLLFLSSFSHFLGCQTPSKDDNLEDERLKPFLLEVEGCWGVGSGGCWRFLCFSRRYARAICVSFEL